MSRRLLIRSGMLSYHVTARSNNKEWFYVPQRSAWKYFTALLPRICELYGAEIHAFVLMSNHFHLLLSTPQLNLDRIVRYLLTEVGRRIRRESKRINHVFGTRYKWSLLPNADALAICLKYIARNPVRAGIVARIEDYPYSSFNLRTLNKSLPICEGFSSYWSRVPKDWNERLEWLNRPSPKEHEQLIKKALRRYEFKFTSRKGELRYVEQLKRDYVWSVHDRDETEEDQK